MKSLSKIVVLKEGKSKVNVSSDSGRNRLNGPPKVVLRGSLPPLVGSHRSVAIRSLMLIVFQVAANFQNRLAKRPPRTEISPNAN